jgi:hypothetical protein
VTINLCRCNTRLVPISGINEGTDALEPVPYSIDFLVIAGGGAGGSEM